MKIQGLAAVRDGRFRAVTSVVSAPALDPTSALNPTPALEMSVEEQLKATWKLICDIRNVDHENGRLSEMETHKHFIDEKCADIRRHSHMQ